MTIKFTNYIKSQLFIHNSIYIHSRKRAELCATPPLNTRTTRSTATKLLQTSSIYVRTHLILRSNCVYWRRRPTIPRFSLSKCTQSGLGTQTYSNLIGHLSFRPLRKVKLLSLTHSREGISTYIPPSTKSLPLVSSLLVSSASVGSRL